MWIFARLLKVFTAALAVSAMASANAATIPLRAWLNGAQVPLEVAGTGLGTVSFDTVTKVLSWNVTYSGLSGACTAAHFHGPASAGVNASPTPNGTMTCSASPLTGSSAALSPTEEAQLLSGQWYINIHTAANPGGEIRGQVLPVRGDVNGDGQSDVVWRNASTGENYLYPMNGTAILGGEGYLRIVADQNWQIAGIGDFDGDGKADILWRNSSTGENYVYLMNGTSIAGEGTLRTVADQSWQVAGVGDFNGDGRADVLWRNTATGENYLYPMDGTTILGTEGSIRTVADQNWQVAGVGDFNGDGNADILWRNGSTGDNYIYPMDGTTILGGEGFIRTVADQSWQVVGVGDFDGDGRSDILWRNGTTGENYIYPMAGTTILATEGYIRTVTDQNWQVAALGDHNGDGRADIFWRHGSTGENYVYPMGGLAILAGEGNVRTVADLAWNAIGAQSPRAIALSGARNAMNQFMAIVNAQGANLAGSHLLGALDTGLLQDGVDRNIYSGELAETLRGATVNSFTFNRVISYDNANKVLAAVVTVVTSIGTFTIDEREGGFSFKRQTDGTWKQYGNQRIAELGVQVEMRTDKFPGSVQGPRQHVNVDVRPLQGTVSTVTITGGNGLADNSPVPFSGSTELVSVQADPPPAAPVTYVRDLYFAGADSALSGPSSFTFTVTPVSGPAVTYTVPSNAVTSQFVTITSPTGTALANANLGGTLMVTWTLPGFAIASVQLSGHVATAVSGGVQCMVEEQELATNATSGNISFPATCNDQPVQSANINVSVDGVNGERTIYIYGFNDQAMN